MTLSSAVSNRQWTILEKVQKHPEVQALSQGIEAGEAEVRRLDGLVAMDRKDRFNADPGLHAECHDMALSGFRTSATFVIVAGLAAGVVAAAVANSIPGVPQQAAGLICLATLAMTFVPAVATRFSPVALYAHVAKKWLIPRKVDRMMLADLQERKAGTDRQLQSLRQQKETASKRILAELQKLEPVAAEGSLAVEEEQVVVNGVALPRRRSA